MKDLLNDPSALKHYITRILQQRSLQEPIFPSGLTQSKTVAAVLFLIGLYPMEGGNGSQPCFIFNKRSIKVRQAGDLCFPGGHMMPRLDSYFSLLLKIPFLPLKHWIFWNQWRKQRPPEARRLSLLLAAGLREAFEEIRLNPLGVHFLGPMPSQRLQIFEREIFPMAVWVNRQRRFFPNWEVEKIVTVPIRYFLEPSHYAACHIHFGADRAHADRPSNIFPCLRLLSGSESEILWGATYRMVMNFMEMVFDFKPPPVKYLPIVNWNVGSEYINRPTLKKSRAKNS